MIATLLLLIDSVGCTAASHIVRCDCRTAAADWELAAQLRHVLVLNAENNKFANMKAKTGNVGVVESIIKDSQFWESTQFMVELLEPFSTAVTVVQVRSLCVQRGAPNTLCCCRASPAPWQTLLVSFFT